MRWHNNIFLIVVERQFNATELLYDLFYYNIPTVLQDTNQTPIMEI